MRALTLQGKRLRVGGWIIAVMGPAFMVGSLWLMQAHQDWFLWLFDEDSLIENAQEVLFLTASVLSGLLARRLWRAQLQWWAVLYGLAAVGLLWVAGEEISWGQRIFSIETPAWLMRHNVQHELNLHNLPGAASTIMRCLYKGLPIVALLSVVGWGFAPRQLRRWHAALWLPRPVLVPLLLSVVSYRWLRTWYYPSGQHVPITFKRLAEAGELVWASAIVAFLLHALQATRAHESGLPQARERGTGAGVIR